MTTPLSCARFLVAAAICCWIAIAADATQHLVSPGQNWERLAQRIQPGDEIILLPGQHVAASFTDLHGTADKPIVIRAFSEDHPVTIRAREVGIELIRPKFVVLRDLNIVGAHEVGLRVDVRDRPGDQPATAWNAALRIERVSIERTGAYEQGIACAMFGVEDVTFKHCTFKGWGSVAVDIDGCQSVRIDHATFSGVETFEQTIGIAMGGGARRIWVTHTRISDVTRSPLLIGRPQRPDTFVPAVDEAAAEVFSAAQVSFDQCTIEGGWTSVAFGSVRYCMFNACTFVNPHLTLLDLTANDRDDLTALRDLDFNGSVFVWNESLEALAALPAELDSETVRFADNLWWTSTDNTFAVQEQPFTFAFPQTTDLDPQLNESLVITAADAIAFGALHPEVADPILPESEVLAETPVDDE